MKEVSECHGSEHSSLWNNYVGMPTSIVGTCKIAGEHSRRMVMTDQIQEKHQLAGFDARERGFSRPVVYEQADGGYQAVLRYETTRVVTTAQATPGAALNELIRILQG